MGPVLSYHAVYTNVKKIKSAAHKDDDIDGTCKQALTRNAYQHWSHLILFLI